MSPAAAPAPLPTKSEIEEWATSHLDTAASTWRSAATASEDAFDQHRQNIASPGGTTWEGNAKDAALDRVTADVAAVERQGSVLREAADLAENGAYDITAAKDKALQAITAAENDGFNVAEDLSVTDSRKYDINTVADRNRAAAEHAEDISWTAQQLVQADKLVGNRLKAKAADLEGIRFEGEGEGGTPPSHVRLVDNKVVQDKPDEDRKDETGDEPAEQATGQVGPFAVPKAVEDAAKKNGLKPDEKPPSPTADDGGLGDLLGANDHPEDKPEGGQSATAGDEKPAGLPPVLSHVPPPPDKATIDRQAAKVEAARQALAAAQTKANDAAVENVTQGAGAGPSRDTAHDLGQAVFEARAELTEQARILDELNYASAAAGGPTALVAPLPENADVQAFPKEPPVLERGAGAFGEGMKDASKTVWDATMPDFGNMYDVATDWDGATAEQKTQAGIDAASMLPFPGTKVLGEGIEHGLDALGAAGRHFDDAPTPHVDVDTPSAGHAPVEHHASPPDAPVEHHAPEPVNMPDPTPTHQLPDPDVFDPHHGIHYPSGDPYHPGGWPPSTPAETWTKGDTVPGIEHVNRGAEKPWMDYQTQITGIERTPDGRIPEWVVPNPDTGDVVKFDSPPILRGEHEVYLDAKHEYAPLFEKPDAPWVDNIRQDLLKEAQRQLNALPDDAILEWHVANPQSAAIMRDLLDSRGLDVHVIYTPQKP